MSNINNASAEQITKECIVCGKPIPLRANYCTYCQNYQNWRRFLQFGAFTLPMLVALLAVGSTLLGPLMTWLDRPNSKMVVANVEAVSDSFRVTVANLGDRPGLVSSFYVEMMLPAKGDPDARFGIPIAEPATLPPNTLVNPGEVKVFELSSFSGPNDDKIADSFEFWRGFDCRSSVTFVLFAGEAHKEFDHQACGNLLFIGTVAKVYARRENQDIEPWLAEQDRWLLSLGAPESFRDIFKGLFSIPETAAP